MPYLYELPNATTGIDDALIQTVSAVNIFIPMFLLFVFGVILIGGSISQKRRTGTSDIPAWATMAGIGTLFVSLPLTLTTGLINLDYLIIIVVVTILSGLWLFLDKNRNEI